MKKDKHSKLQQKQKKQQKKLKELMAKKCWNFKKIKN